MSLGHFSPYLSKSFAICLCLCYGDTNKMKRQAIRGRLRLNLCATRGAEVGRFSLRFWPRREVFPSRTVARVVANSAAVVINDVLSAFWNRGFSELMLDAKDGQSDGLEIEVIHWIERSGTLCEEISTGWGLNDIHKTGFNVQ